MPVYEFQCPHGHVSEALVPVGTQRLPCDRCTAEAIAGKRDLDSVYLATRILSPSPTTFRFADRRK